MASYLLDTSALVSWFKGRPRAIGLLDDLIRREQTLAVCAVTIAELYSGISGDDIERVGRLVARFPYWDIDRETAALAGTIRYGYAKRGRPLSTPDTLLAALAITMGAALVTGNVRDFPMEGLEILPLPAD